MEHRAANIVLARCGLARGLRLGEPALEAAYREDRFERAASSFSRGGGGSTAGERSVGFGLSLVKKWIEAIGGAVGCESELGRGATFWLSLPLE